MKAVLTWSPALIRVARNLSASLVETHLVMAGAVAPLRSLASTANECSFASVSRAAKKGGGYVVTIADLPQPSLYVSSPPPPLSFLWHTCIVVGLCYHSTSIWQM